MMPDISAAHPVTAPERLPEIAGSSWTIWIVLAALAGLTALIAVYRWRKPMPHTSDDDWARARVAELDPSQPAVLARLSAIIREHLQRKYAIPAPNLTTPEIGVELSRAGHPAERLTVLLNHCDEANFAGWAAKAEEVAELIRTAQTLLSEDLASGESVSMGQSAKTRKSASSLGDSSAD